MLASQEGKATATMILLCSQSAVLRVLIQIGEMMSTMSEITYTRRATSAVANMSVEYADICILLRTKMKSVGQLASYEGRDDHSLNDNSVPSYHMNGEERFLPDS
jgi:hypothetical protein